MGIYFCSKINCTLQKFFFEKLLPRKQLGTIMGNGIFAPVHSFAKNFCVDWDRALLLCTKILFKARLGNREFLAINQYASQNLFKYHSNIGKPLQSNAGIKNQ
jgi:hypothetical protein